MLEGDEDDSLKYKLVPALPDGRTDVLTDGQPGPQWGCDGPLGNANAQLLPLFDRRHSENSFLAKCLLRLGSMPLAVGVRGDI